MRQSSPIFFIPKMLFFAHAFSLPFSHATHDQCVKWYVLPVSAVSTQCQRTPPLLRALAPWTSGRTSISSIRFWTSSIRFCGVPHTPTFPVAFFFIYFLSQRFQAKSCYAPPLLHHLTYPARPATVLTLLHHVLAHALLR